MIDSEEPTGADPAELQFRLDSVPAGAWVTFAICAAGILYVLFWDHAHEGALAALFAVGALGGGVVLALPWQRIVRSRSREVVFILWSTLDIVLILAIAAVDGGGDSVLAVLMVVPIVFAAVSYPRVQVLVISAAAILGYVVLAIATSTPGDYTLMLTTALATTALMSDWQARNHQRRRELLAIASRTDPLTGALNRRGFQQAAAAALASTARLGTPMALVLADLDRFKHFNDTHGHAAGDELLTWTVERIRSSQRPNDAVARLGGDEFALVLTGADRSAAQAAVRRITEDLKSRIHVSWGIATAPDDGIDIDELYRRADAELYGAKRALAEPGTVSQLRR